ncbi:hypothetical protein C8034_v011259 [Colletotrichum sidae]|uniref:Uncharacterized protein n=1 Tax=Colletotrichum sidae TaxID=1347389 RepID=A0A4R8TCR8_9PEZI|nr:hypothetical protein C8034_v011259 [Colletotrichum sidae]
MINAGEEKALRGGGARPRAVPRQPFERGVEKMRHVLSSTLLRARNRFVLATHERASCETTFFPSLGFSRCSETAVRHLRDFCKIHIRGHHHHHHHGVKHERAVQFSAAHLFSAS